MPCTAKEAELKIEFINPDALCRWIFFLRFGHLKLENGSIVLLYEKRQIIDQLYPWKIPGLAGLFKNAEDIYDSAHEHYHFNIIGSFMEEIPALAILE